MDVPLPRPGRPDAEAVIVAVADVAESWAQGDWPGQAGLLSRIAGVSSFSAQVVKAGLAAHFGAMSAVELRRWSGRSLDLPPIRGRIAILPATNIPGVGLVPAVAALLAGAEALIKTSAAEPHLMPAWRNRIAAVDASVGAMIRVEEWVGGADPREHALLAACDRIVVLGSDSTIEDVLTRYGGHSGGAGLARRVIGLGTGASLAVVGAGADLTAASRRLARDVSIWDQQGCLSPQGLAVIGPRSTSMAMMEQLAAALDTLENELPVGQMSTVEAAGLRGFRADLTARRQAGEAIQWRESTPRSDVRGPARWLVWTDDEIRFEPSPGRRHLWVRSAASIDELVRCALPPAGHRQAAGLDESDPERSKFAAALSAARVPCIAALGSMQAPPVDWPNKGHDLLAELKRSAA